ncbi:MAG: Mov34/MPN/PAD-1 family protein [Parcubacteria group bacterium]|nr:Mov34/MPN/PAD-1 family protein [Parcubacteria group bacterium]
MIPVCILDGTTICPDKDFVYLIGENGIFLKKKTPHWDAIVPVNKISILEKVVPSVTLHLPPIPETIVREMLHLFAWVYKTYGTEAMILLWWNEEEKTYHLSVPFQTVSAGGIDYTIPERNETEKSERLIGTFHSHGSLDAYHSGTDRCDEKSLDGIHGTFGRFSGNIFQQEFALSIEVVINGARFPLEPQDWLQGITKQRDIDPTPQYYYSPWQQKNYHRTPLFALTQRGSILPGQYTPPEDWKNKIHKRTFWQGYTKKKEQQTEGDLSSNFGFGIPQETTHPTGESVLISINKKLPNNNERCGHPLQQDRLIEPISDGDFVL